MGARYTVEDCIKKSKEIHKDYYDYSLVKEYINQLTKIPIICPIHGVFWQTPKNHWRGQGCPECGRDSQLVKVTPTTEDFIRNANKRHNYRYTYPNVIYKGPRVKVPIVCPVHGEFWQTPNCHLKGRGCPICSCSKMELDVMEILKIKGLTLDKDFYREYSIDVPTNINISGKAYIDFYIPSMNVFIECNGKQHYIPQIDMGGEIAFQKQQLRDDFVRSYCNSNNITLLEIRYDEDVWDTLNKLFPSGHNDLRIVKR